MALITEQDLIAQAGGLDEWQRRVPPTAPDYADRVSAMIADAESFITLKLGRRLGDLNELGDPALVAPVRMLAARYAVMQYRLKREAGTDPNLNAEIERTLSEMSHIASGVNWPGLRYGPDQVQRTGIGFHPSNVDEDGEAKLDIMRKVFA